MRDYRASERLRYVDAFFTNIDWATVERRFNEGQAQRSSAAA
jgi:superoxide dismutase